MFVYTRTVPLFTCLSLSIENPLFGSSFSTTLFYQIWGIFLLFIYSFRYHKPVFNGYDLLSSGLELTLYNYLERSPTNAGCFSFPNANKRSFTFSAFTIFRATPVSIAALATAAATWAATLGSNGLGIT